MQKNRVIIDTNLWISLLLTKDFLKFEKVINNKQITLLFSSELLNELIEVMGRKKFSKYFSDQDIAAVLEQIQLRAIFIKVKSKVAACRDPKDNFLLALAADGKATHLLTGDKDLIVLKTFGKTSIVTINEYLKEI
jgi:putative PIN family toxin of toxin-antitoxin system